MESVRDMVISLGLVLLLVALIAGFVGAVRGSPDPVRGVDYEAAAVAAAETAPFTVLVPVDLPGGWEATSARLEPGPVPVWRLGFVSPAEDYAGLTQSGDSAERARAEHLGEYEPDGSSVVDSRTWDRYVETDTADPDVALVSTLDEPDGESTVILIGSAGYSELEEFAGYLEPVSE